MNSYWKLHKNIFLAAAFLWICSSITLSAQWDKIGELSETIVFPMLTVQGEIAYFVGGFSPSTSSDLAAIYTISQSGEVQKLTDMPTIRAAGYAAIVNNQLYVVGGTSRSGATGNIPGEYRFDLNTQNWEEIAQLPEPVDFFGGTVYQNNLYIVGGERAVDQFARPTQHVYRLSLSDNEWKRLSDLPVPLSYLSLAEQDGMLYVVGGKAGMNPEDFTSSYAFRGRILSDDSIYWERLPDYPLSISGASIGVLDNSVLVAGGYTVSGQTTASYFFHERQKEWVMADPLPWPIAFGAAASDGEQMVIAGGTDNLFILRHSSVSSASVADDPKTKSGEMQIPLMIVHSNQTVDFAEMLPGIKSHNDFTLSLYTLLGKEIDCGESNQKYLIDFQGIVPGHYFVVFDDGVGRVVAVVAVR